jgi:hypothetical protein
MRVSTPAREMRKRRQRRQKRREDFSGIKEKKW